MKKQLRSLFGKAVVIGVIATEADAKIAMDDPNIAGGYEFRIDKCNSPNIQVCMGFLRQLGKLIIITVRDACERGGQPGQPSWTIEERAKWYRYYRHMATFYDIEASTAEALKDVIKEAQRKGVGIIISYHNFERMVSSQRLKRAYEVCAAVKGDIFKAAVQLETLTHLNRLINFVLADHDKGGPMIAIMAMGKKFGPVSRHLFGIEGSALVYGYLGEAVVEGQLHVTEIRKLLDRAVG